MATPKPETALRSISEAASEIGVPQHVLRFWETRFPQLQPMKRGGNRRYYRPADMALLRRIRAMLHDEGLTIRGAQRALAAKAATPETSAAAPDTPPLMPPLTPPLLAPLADADRALLRAIRDRLRDVLAA